MAAKLKSILRQIPSSLLLRTVVFALAWLVLPFWLFLLIAVYLYFVPFFQPWRLALPFLLLLFFTWIEAPGFWLAVFFAALFYLILGIKDLVFIDRKPAYEILILLLSFFLFVKFFSRFDDWASFSAFSWAFLVGLSFFFVARGFMGYGGGAGEAAVLPSSKRTNIAILILGLIIWQITLTLLFLPLNFFFQAAILFLVAVIALESLVDYLGRRLTRDRLLMNFSIFFIFLVIILGSAQWGL